MRVTATAAFQTRVHEIAVTSRDRDTALQACELPITRERSRGSSIRCIAETSQPDRSREILLT